MATKFVNSGAAGANNGTSWTDAWTDLGSATGVAAGDIVKVHKAHAQTGRTTNMLFGGTLTNPVYIICVDKNNSDALDTGASVTYATNNNIGIGGNVRVRGMTLSCSSNVSAPVAYAPNNGHAEFELCTFTCSGTSLFYPGFNTNQCLVRFNNCTFDFSGSTGVGSLVVLQTEGSKRLEFNGCTFTARGAGQTSYFRLDSTSGGSIAFRGCVLNGTVTNLIATVNARPDSELTFDYCTMPTYTNLAGGSASNNFCQRIEIRNSVGGTISAPVIGPQLISDYAGTITTELTKYRDGGANDGTSPYSLKMVTNASALETHGFLTSPPLVRRVASGAQTITIYIASGTTYQDDEIWVELFSPSEAGSPTAQARLQSSQMAVLGAAANLTTDGGSTWTGSGVGTLQKVSFSIAPTVAGNVVARVFLARASQTIYVDPFIGVS